MLKNRQEGPNLVPLILVILLAGVIACGQLPFLGSQDPGQQAAERAATLEVELADARATATNAALSLTESEPAGQPAEGEDEESPQFSEQLELDFSSPSGSFNLGEQARVEDGALLLGPYESCANDVANFDNPVDCLVVCQACGSQVGQYRMAFDFTYEDGLADREFGAILRFVDEDGNGLIDKPDYLLALGFNIYDNRWRLYLHEPNQIEPWREVGRGRAGFLQAGRLNHVEIQTTEGGRNMEIYLNDARITLLTGDEPEPNERLVQPWVEQGAVGFLGLGRGVTARFDNFVFESR